VAPELIYFSRFLPSTERGGGSRRMMQIWELLQGLAGDCEVVSTQRKDHLPEAGQKRIAENVSRSISGGDYPLWSETRRHAVCRLREVSREWSRNIADLPRLKLAVLDDPIYFIPLLEKLQQLHIPVIAVCHNLETLAPGQVVADSRRVLFFQEIDALAGCQLVITISREESFLLRNLGIPNVFYPYYPGERILTRLQRVREKRKKTEKQGLLLLGSVFNVQSRQGMSHVVDAWATDRRLHEHGTLLVAGYGTEKYLAEAKNRPAVDFLGELSDDALDDCLTRVKACLCFQESGSGALTRICEMLIAAVPVLANSHAARTYYNVKGVIEYRGLADLAEALTRRADFDCEIPLPPMPDASELAAKVKEILFQKKT